MAEPRDPVFELSDQLVSAFSALSPIAASMAGVPGVHDGWDDYTPEGGEAALSFFRDYQRRLAALPPASDPWAVVARRVMADFLSERALPYEHKDHLADLNNIESPVQHLRMVFDVMDTAEREGWEAIATRLATIDRPMKGYAAALREGVRQGHVAARRQVEAALAQVRWNASDKTTFADLLASYDGAGVADAGLRARLERGVEHARASSAALASELEAYLADATPTDAVGRERYSRASRRFLGMDIDPLETYAWGFREIADIEAKMREVTARIAPGKDVATVIRELQTSPAQLVHGSEEFLAMMRARQQAALDDLQGKHFEVPEPVRRIEVKLAPAGGALGAYYIPPSDGFRRPGTVYYAPTPGQPFTLFTEITTAYHEGFPGHHLQCGLQVYLADRLSQLHRLFVVCSGYAEGWALYAEQLMDELGYLERPEFVLGMHMAKLFRAVRVVVDIGMHLGLAIPSSFDFHPGETWSHDLCVEMLTTRAFIPTDFARSETVRYLGWPGQAISYKVGERVMLELREEARRAQGPAFDLRKFHEVVLGTGSVGLSHLQDLVRASISAPRAAS